MDPFPPGFEKCDSLRSDYIRVITLQQLERTSRSVDERLGEATSIPKRLIRYWHDPSDLPEDVRVCLNSWDRLGDEGFEFYMFDDASAAEYIVDHACPVVSQTASMLYGNSHHPFGSPFL